ncbi:hypothetical protein Q1695_009205 [Nippostrongylus brasiliensis]|nr:hypothetical protein Q1695_009205 [Nippostrongylus brasiliensis]
MSRPANGVTLRIGPRRFQQKSVADFYQWSSFKKANFDQLALTGDVMKEDKQGDQQCVQVKYMLMLKKRSLAATSQLCVYFDE